MDKEQAVVEAAAAHQKNQEKVEQLKKQLTETNLALAQAEQAAEASASNLREAFDALKRGA